MRPTVKIKVDLGLVEHGAELAVASQLSQYFIHLVRTKLVFVLDFSI